MSHRPNELDRADARDATFDDAARAAHDAALQRVSARVEAQLHQRRRAALSGRAAAAPRALWPMLAVGGTAALALAIGLRFANDVTDPADPSATQTPSVASTAIDDTAAAEIERWLSESDDGDDDALLAANDDAMFAALDENPDLYLWLGSEESLAETTESL